jgi:hypothetical protein
MKPWEFYQMVTSHPVCSTVTSIYTGCDQSINDIVSALCSFSGSKTGFFRGKIAVQLLEKRKNVA